MSRVLIAGCGYVGQATADLFHQAGWQVQGWTHSERSAAELSHTPYPVIAVDLADAGAIGARPENFEAVIHCASTRGGDADLYRRVYLQGARNLINRFVGSTILFTSSTSVYAQTDGSWVTEMSETEPAQETSRVLLVTEELVRDGGGIVARLAGIYGPGRSALLRKFVAGEATIDLKKDRFINQVHRDDIAAAFLLLMNQKASAGGIYNVVDDQPILQSECYRWLGQRLGRAVPSIGRPVPSAAEGSTSRQKRGASNKKVSNAKLRSLGWAPRYSNFAEAMEKSVLPSFSLPASTA
ncbi:MAG: NAD-dependent epimerase/dehydratase family protein [Chthoniobacterales bacterium]